MFGLSRALLSSVFLHAGLLACVGLAFGVRSAPRGLHVALVLDEAPAVASTEPGLAEPASVPESFVQESPPPGATEEGEIVEEPEAAAEPAAPSEAVPSPRDSSWSRATDAEDLLRPLRQRVEPTTPPAPDAAEAAPTLSPPASHVEAANVISALPGVNEPPPYPPLARKRRLEGRVELWVEVDHAGHVLSVRVRESSGHALLDGAALRAVRAWHFTPGPGSTVLAIRFRLEDR